MSERTKTPATATIAAALALPVLLLAGCGQKGPLYMPDRAREIVTRPVQTPDPAQQTEPAPNSPQTVDSPSAGVSPAPEVTGPANAGSTDPDKKKAAAPPPK